MDKTSSFIADVLLRVSLPRAPYSLRILRFGDVWFQLDELLKAESEEPQPQKTSLQRRDVLIEIAALACRAARDLEIEGAADAAEKDIPF